MDKIQDKFVVKDEKPTKEAKDERDSKLKRSKSDK